MPPPLARVAARGHLASATLALQATGLERVWQLDGGILGYLERLGARHWHGDCVVFDERGAVDERLAPTAR